MGFAGAQPILRLFSIWRKAGRDLGERRARAIFGRTGRPPDVDEARDALVRQKPQRVEYGAVVGVPFRDPVGCVAERVRGGVPAGVRTFLPSCLVSQITLALESSSAAGSPCNLAGGATTPVDETKATIANSPAATKAARLAHAGISVPPHLKPGGNLLRRPYRAAGFVPAIDVLLLGAQHKDARVRHKGLISSYGEHADRPAERLRRGHGAEPVIGPAASGRAGERPGPPDRYCEPLNRASDRCRRDRPARRSPCPARRAGDRCRASSLRSASQPAG